MDNEIQVFANSEFGKLRTIIEEDKIYFAASDAAKMLGYARPADAITSHCKGSVKRRLPTNGGVQEMKVITEGDLYRLIAHSELPSAQAFETWIFDEVLPTIRKTGSYAVNKGTMSIEDVQALRAQTMAENTKNRRAKLWMQIAESTDIPEFKHVATVYAANTLAGKMILELPEVKERTYTATEIGKMLGISAAKVGRIANKYNLKTEENGKLFYDKSPNSSKEVETFRYYERALDAFKAALEKEGV